MVFNRGRTILQVIGKKKAVFYLLLVKLGTVAS